MDNKITRMLAKTVSVILAEKGLTKSDFARMMGVSRQSVGKYLDAERSPTLDTVIAMAKALNVPAFYLLMTPLERARWEAFNQAIAQFDFPSKK